MTTYNKFVHNLIIATMVAMAWVPLAQGVELVKNGQTKGPNAQTVQQAATPYANKVDEIDKSLLSASEQLMNAGGYTFKRDKKTIDRQQRALADLQVAINRRQSVELLYHSTMQNIHSMDPESVRASEATVKEIEQMHRDLKELDPQLAQIARLSRKPKSGKELALALQALVQDPKFNELTYFSVNFGGDDHWSYSGACP